MKLRRRLLVLLVALPLLSACKEKKEDGSLPTPPISLPFEVQKSGAKIDTAFRIEEQRKYSFDLLFRCRMVDPINYAHVRELVGESGINKITGKQVAPGIPIPLRIRLMQTTTSGEKIILDKEVSELTLYGASAEYFYKEIVSLHVPPGSYRVSIESLKDAPELQGTQIEFAIVRAYIGK